MISVAVFAHDRADRLLDLVASVLPQLEPDDEIVIITGTSDDGAPSNMVHEVADEIARQVPSVRVSESEGQDEIADFAQAVRLCRGTYLFMAEPGDVWFPTKVSEVLATFAGSNSVLVLHDAALIDVERKLSAPSLFAIRGSASGLSENLFRNAYLGSCMVFLKPFCELLLPIPEDASGYDQWAGLVAERYGGVAVIERPLLQKFMSAGDKDMLSNLGLQQRNDEQRRLLKVLKKRDKELHSGARS
jgi:hypothetical protein